MTNLYPKVDIILLNWNQKKDTIDCLESLRNLNYTNYEIIVVDQDSKDGTQDIIRSRFPNVILIENKENVGFAEGNNIGIRKAFEGNPDYIFLLNNDTVVDINILHNLIKLAETDLEIGLVGAKIFYFDFPDKIWFAGGKMDWIRGLSVNLGAEQKDDSKYDQMMETDFISGCAFLIKRNVIEKIGLLDKRYFIYFEEIDWCIRAKKAGYKIEESVTGDNTMVVYFPIAEPNFDRAKANVTIWEQLENAAQMQHYWADNQVSITVTFNPEQESRDIPNALEMYESKLKVVSFLPSRDHSYKQAPYQEITEKE